MKTKYRQIFFAVCLLLFFSLFVNRPVFAAQIKVGLMGDYIDTFRGIFRGTEITVENISPQQIQQGNLQSQGFDVVLMPGGLSSQQSRQLGVSGKNQVKDFVNQGGGYAGFCAGAYLASSDGVSFEPLGLANVRVIQPTNPGIGNMEIQFMPEAANIISNNRYHFPNKRDILHYNGPLWDTKPFTNSRSPVHVVSQFTGQGSTTRFDGSVFQGRASMIYDYYGQGCVMLSSSHPEFSANLGNQQMLPEIFRWLASCDPPDITPAITSTPALGSTVTPGGGVSGTPTPSSTPIPIATPTPIPSSVIEGYIHPGIDIEPAGVTSNSNYVYSTHAGFVTYAGPAPPNIAEKGWMVQIESDLNRDNVADMITRYTHLFEDTITINDFKYKRINWTPDCFMSLSSCVAGILGLSGELTEPIEKLPYGYGPYVARNQLLGVVGDTGSPGHRHIQYEIVTNRYIDTYGAGLDTYSCQDDPYLEACTNDPSRPGFFFPINRNKGDFVRSPVYINPGLVTPPPALTPITNPNEPTPTPGGPTLTPTPPIGSGTPTSTPIALISPLINTTPGSCGSLSGPDVKFLCKDQTYNGWAKSPIEITDMSNTLKVVCNCKFLNTADKSITDPAIKIHAVNNLLVEGSEFNNIRTHIPGEDVGAIKFGNQGGSEVIKNVTIRNNKFDKIGSDGIPIGDTSPRTSNVIVEGNEFIGYEDVGENAMDIKSGDGPIIIRNNYMHGFRPCEDPVNRGGNQDCSGSNGPAIVIHTGGHLGSLTSAPKNITVENNRFHDNTIGVTVNTGDNIVLRNNTYTSNGTNCVIVNSNATCK